MVGWVRKAEIKAQAQHSWGLDFAELGKRQIVAVLCYVGILLTRQ